MPARPELAVGTSKCPLAACSAPEIRRAVSALSSISRTVGGMGMGPPEFEEGERLVARLGGVNQEAVVAEDGAGGVIESWIVVHDEDVRCTRHDTGPAGRRTVKQVPARAAQSTDTVPPWVSTIRLTTLSPTPLPGTVSPST